MERIASFNVDHTRLRPGLYVSRRDSFRGATVTTFDLRVTAPNVENVMGTGAAHTLEHIVATWLRNSARKDEVVYFGPMGCRTGFYLLMFGDQTPESVLPLVREAFAYAAGFEGDVPGASPSECGNWSDQDLPSARAFARKYIAALEDPVARYPENTDE